MSWRSLAQVETGSVYWDFPLLDDLQNAPAFRGVPGRRRNDGPGRDPDRPSLADGAPDVILRDEVHRRGESGSLGGSRRGRRGWTAGGARPLVGQPLDVDQVERRNVVRSDVPG